MDDDKTEEGGILGLMRGTAKGFMDRQGAGWMDRQADRGS